MVGNWSVNSMGYLIVSFDSFLSQSRSHHDDAKNTFGKISGKSIEDKISIWTRLSKGNLKLADFSSL